MDATKPSLSEIVARANNSSKTDPTWRTDYSDSAWLAAEVAAGRACGSHDRPLPCVECAND